MNEFAVILAIIGVVVGSGFVSGREIVTFFSRFGIWSFPCIILSFFLFWKLFSFLLNYHEKLKNKVENTRFSCIINLIICFIFCSAMFAGTSDLITFDNKFISIFLFFIVIFLCYIIYKNGLGTLKKINFILIPLMLIILIVSIFVLFKFNVIQIESEFSSFSIIYSILYCILNTSNGSVLLISLGKGLNKKQRARAAFISALVLSSLLFITNIVLLGAPSSFSNDMPLLSLCSGPLRIFMNFVVLIGCLTSLFSLIYTSSELMRGLCSNEFLIFLVSVIFPLVASFLGFGIIVTYLYPIASAFGVFLLGELWVKSKKGKLNFFRVFKKQR